MVLRREIESPVWLNGTLRLVIGGLFLVAEIAKIATWSEFAARVQVILALPRPGFIHFLISGAVICAELTAALMMTRSVWVRPGSAIAYWLGGAVLVAHAIRKLYHVALPCNCFGPLYHVQPVPSFILDLIVLAGSLWLFARYPRRNA